MANRQVSEGRKATYYLGVAISTLGFLLFLSCPLGLLLADSSRPTKRKDSAQSSPIAIEVGSLAELRRSSFKDFHEGFEKRRQEGFAARDRAQSAMVRGVLGFVFMIVGGAIANVGKQGLAGSGVVLDPEKAREDVEPWSRMQGGVIKDTLDEAGLDLSRIGSGPMADDDLPFDEKLRRLHALHQDGILTDAEYEREKRELLDNN